MILIIRALFISTCLTCSCAAATIQMDAKRVLNVSLSKNGINRICVEGDEINNILVNPVHLQNDIHLDDTGHLFVMGSDVTREAYISLVSASGFVQDLKVTFENQHPEPLFLKAVSSLMPEDTPMSLEKGDAANLLRKVLKGDFGEWREVSSLNSPCSPREGNKLLALPKRHFIHKDGDLTLSEFKVESPCPILPGVGALKQDRDVALVFNERTISPNTKLFVIQERKNI